jgi:tRNA(Ile)-lysidine synthase
MENKVFAYIRQYHMIEEGDRIVAGVSGGADSVCLLAVLREYQKRVPFQLGVVHVNHQLRGEEARRDADYVDRLCRKWELPYREYTYPVAEMAREGHMSLEEAGRKARYEAFRRFMEEWGGDKTALAHHQNDAAETFLYHLARGSGIRGLCGIRPVRERIIRPLLGVERQEIENYLEEKGIEYLTDSTNLSLDYMRNKIRHQVLPVLVKDINEQTVSHIARTAQILLEAENYLEKQADNLRKEYVREEKGRIRVSKELFAKEEILQQYVLRGALGQLAGGLKDIGMEHVQSLMRLPGRGAGKLVSLPYGIQGKMGYEALWLTVIQDEEPASGEAPELIWHWRKFSYENQPIPENKYTKWFDYDKIEAGLNVRERRPGDFLVVNASGGRKKLKDYLIDCKVPRHERDRIPLLADGSHIVWAVGYRISEYYKVTHETKTVLEVRVEGGIQHE